MGSLPDGTKVSDEEAAARGFIVKPEERNEPVPASISGRQFFHALALGGTITQVEAMKAVKTGDLPASLVEFIGRQSTATDKFSAEMILVGATIFERTHPMTEAMRVHQGWTVSQLDDFFRFAATL